MEKSCSVLEIFTVIISNYPVNPVNFHISDIRMSISTSFYPPPFLAKWWEGGRGRRTWRFFFRGELVGKGGPIFRWGLGLLEIAIINSTLWHILLTIKVQTVRCCVTCYFSLMFLAHFVLLNYFLLVSYFINSLFKG